MLINKISVPCIITHHKPHLFKPSIIELIEIERVQPIDFLDTFNRNCINYEVDEINIIFISDLKNLTFFHCMSQPKRLFCRKLVKNFIEEDFGDFNCMWLHNGFRHINVDSNPNIFCECESLLMYIEQFFIKQYL